VFSKVIKNPKLILILSISFFLSLVIYSFFFQNQRVLGKKTQEAQSTLNIPSNSKKSPPPQLTPSPLISPTPKLSKTTYTIALYGDSMIDTMGEKLDYLDKALKAKYLQTNFQLYNYGIGSQNIEEGLARFENNFSYQSRNYPPIGQIKPDVIILGSFSYNVFPEHDKIRHYQKLSELVLKAKQITPNVYLLVEIAPLKTGFGKGEGGVNWPQDVSYNHALKIIDQLENAISLASQVGIIDAYKLSRNDGRFGNPVYVSGHDGIHPSTEGHVLMANLISRTIKLK